MTSYLISTSATSREHIVDATTGVALCGSDATLPLSWSKPSDLSLAMIELADSEQRGRKHCARCLKSASPMRVTAPPADERVDVTDAERAIPTLTIRWNADDRPTPVDVRGRIYCWCEQLASYVNPATDASERHFACDAHSKDGAERMESSFADAWDFDTFELRPTSKRTTTVHHCATGEQYAPGTFESCAKCNALAPVVDPTNELRRQLDALRDENARLRSQLAGSAFEQTYNGHANRETWALSMELDNDPGLYDNLVRRLRSLFEYGEPFDVAEAAAELQRWVCDELLADEARFLTPTTKLHMRSAVGSFWRVDWRELAESYRELVDGASL